MELYVHMYMYLESVVYVAFTHDLVHTELSRRGGVQLNISVAVVVNKIASLYRLKCLPVGFDIAQRTHKCDTRAL